MGAMLAVPLTSVLRIITSDLIENGAAGPYLKVLNVLLEGRPLDFAFEPGSDQQQDPLGLGENRKSEPVD